MTRSDDRQDSSFDSGEQILEITLSCGELVTALSRSLFILRQKRRTLEEKAISNYFHQATQLLGLIVAKLHRALEKGEEKNIESTQLVLLETTTGDLKTRVDELLKILHYNLNFLEQYFEHDFFTKLSTESEALQNLQLVHEKLNVGCSSVTLSDHSVGHASH